MHARTHLTLAREDQGGTRGYLRSILFADLSNQCLEHMHARKKKALTFFLLDDITHIHRSHNEHIDQI